MDHRSPLKGDSPGELRSVPERFDTPVRGEKLQQNLEHFLRRESFQNVTMKIYY